MMTMKPAVKTPKKKKTSPATKRKKPLALESSISSIERLEQMLAEAENELDSLQPQIDKLEAQVTKLSELKRTKQKLITLKLSVKSILNNFSQGLPDTSFTENGLVSLGVNGGAIGARSSSVLNNRGLTTSHGASQTLNRTFLPDVAFEQANRILKQKTSLNYELFRAIVLSGGQASTQAIKQFLVDHKITTPGSGESFADIALTDISSRVNYLIRKGLVTSEGRGIFRSTLGWED